MTITKILLAVLPLFSNPTAGLKVGVFRIDISGPNGKQIPALSGRILHRAGITEQKLQLAWNDPAGKYTLRATDIATGVAKEVPFEVEGD
jgi:hypothetical protein